MEVQVFAAASLTDALKDLTAPCERSTGIRLKFVFGGSQALGRQIEAGAPADLLVAADETSLVGLEAKGRLVAESRRILLTNTLAVVVPMDNPVALADGPAVAAWLREMTQGGGRLALGDPAIVPSGRYAREYLTKLGAWGEVDARVLPCENVRAALAAVAAGNAAAGIVYATDAAIEPRVRVARAIPAQEGPKIFYPAAIVTESRKQADAAKVLEWLGGPEAEVIWKKRGFGTPVRL